MSKLRYQLLSTMFKDLENMVMNAYNENIYPTLPKGGSDFRLRKSCEILSKLENEEAHYSQVSTKYSKLQNTASAICSGSGTLGVILSTAGLGTSLSGFGIIVGLPLGTIGGFCGLTSIVSSMVVKKIGRKLSKHEAIVILAKSKINSIKDLISKAIQDEKVSDNEFSIIIKEIEKYNEMKSEIRNDKKNLEENFSLEMQILKKEVQEIHRLIPSAP